MLMHGKELWLFLSLSVMIVLSIFFQLWNICETEKMVGARVGVSLIKRQKGCPETVFEFLKRDSDVVFDAEHDFRICFLF